MVNAGIKQAGRGTVSERLHAPGAARSLIVAFAVVAAGVLGAPSAAARPEYPGQLQTAAAMDCTPACTVCHTDPAGGADHLRETAIWTPLVTAALTGMDSSLMGDTDKDSVSDLAELRAGTDPGSAADTLICTPKYGCFARVARSAPQDDGAAVAAALVVAALAVSAGRRRRRAS